MKERITCTDIVGYTHVYEKEDGKITGLYTILKGDKLVSVHLYKEGKRHGHFNKFFKDGTNHSFGTYSEDKLHGWVFYIDDEILSFAILYNMDKAERIESISPNESEEYKRYKKILNL